MSAVELVCSAPEPDPALPNHVHTTKAGEDMK